MELPHPMKFIPTNSSFVFEPITTPNKNIHSYFMRSDTSHYVPESLRFQSSEDPIQILIIDGYFVVSGSKIEQDIVVNSRMNIEKYGSIQRCSDEIYRVLKNTMSLNLKELNTRVSPVQLIVSDFIGRSDIILMIDIIINQLGFYAISVLPFSLCLSFSLNQCSCCFVYSTGFSFIDDFCLIDNCDVIEDSYVKTRIDDEDFAEEYSRLDYNKQLLEIEGRRYSCDECGQKEDTEEKIRMHISKDHSGVEDVSFFEYAVRDNMIDNLKDRMRYIFNKEKYERVSKKIYSVGGLDLEGLEYTAVEDPVETAILGAQVFSGLEVSKELWMTEFEWRSVRLRILKEKVLFYI